MSTRSWPFFLHIFSPESSGPGLQPFCGVFSKSLRFRWAEHTEGRFVKKTMRFQKYMHSCVRFINWRCGIFNQLKFISLHRSVSLLKKKFRIWLRIPRVLIHSIYFSINCKRFAKIIIINEWYLLSSLRFVIVHASNNTGNFNLTLKWICFLRKKEIIRLSIFFVKWMDELSE